MADPKFEDHEDDLYDRNVSYKSGRIVDRKKFDEREYYDRKDVQKDDEKAQSKYEHDQVILNRRAKASKLGYLPHEPGERSSAYATGRGSGRGDRGGYLSRGRGSSQYPFTGGAYPSSGRGRGVQHFAPEAYQFKAKDKGEDKRLSKVELEPDSKPSV